MKYCDARVQTRRADVCGLSAPELRSVTQVQVKCGLIVTSLSWSCRPLQLKSTGCFSYCMQLCADLLQQALVIRVQPSRLTRACVHHPMHPRLITRPTTCFSTMPACTMGLQQHI